ncbi:MAG: heme-copper oxidase subunit III [Spirochaetia bacterium]|nr:heme-copper oxidase subunit III [Spirochaetia bacterium]
MENKQRLSDNQHIIPNGLLGMIFMISVEIMFFSGLISGYVVNRAEKPGAWDTPWNHILPVEQTLINTILLLVSAITIFISFFIMMKKRDTTKSRIFLILTFVLGLFFVILQGREWIDLINYGLTTTSSIFGAFFYTIIGAHGIHVIFGLGILTYIYFKISRKNIQPEEKSFSILVGSLYWYFVVFLWPILYYLVYLS